MRKYLLGPITLIYGLITAIRNLLFNKGILRSTHFSSPFVIGVGNLSTGGTGKSPHVIFLTEALRKQYKTAILSRGYKRKTTGFILSSERDSIETIGDEPSMYRQRFLSDVSVAVCEDRVSGIKQIMSLLPSTQVVILDDSFQHRKVVPAINILITPFHKPYFRDHILPSGNLRESASGRKRADIVIVSKSPESLSKPQKQEFIHKLKLGSDQHVFFSFLHYSRFIPAFKNAPDISASDVVLLTGIADPEPLIDHLKQNHQLKRSFIFPDHHQFSVSELSEVVEYFNNIASPEKVILTTEKDLMRLQSDELKSLLIGLPVYYIRAEVAFSDNDKHELLKIIESGIHGGTN